MDSRDHFASTIVEYVGELAAAGGREGIGLEWRLVRDGIESNVVRLREALTPHGEPVFVHIPPDQRPFQMLVLAAEYWRSRGAVTAGPSWEALCACCQLCAVMIEQKEIWERKERA